MHLVAVGGSDAGISAALRARELDPTTDVTVVVADAYPNFSICGIPYYVSGEVTHWRNLAHRTHADLEATGMRLRLDTTAIAIDVPGQRIAVRDRHGAQSWLDYDELVVGTGAVPVRPPIAGLDQLGPADGVHLLHSMGDTFALTHTLDTIHPRSALIVGAGYVGLEMAEGLTARGLQVTQVEMLPEVLPTVDPELGALVHAELSKHGVHVHTRTTVTGITRTDGPARLHVEGTGPDNQPRGWDVDLVLVVVGVRPDTDLLVAAGATAGPRGAVRRRRDHGHRTAARVGRRRLRRHPPPATRADLPALGHHRTQTGPRRRPERPRRHRPLRRIPGHPGRQSLRPRRRPHRTP